MDSFELGVFLIITLPHEDHVFRVVRIVAYKKFTGFTQMATKYKIDGAKFADMESLREALWPLYQDSMSEDEFNAYIADNVEEIDS